MDTHTRMSLNNKDMSLVVITRRKVPKNRYSKRKIPISGKGDTG
jgi:hypothetical protein